MLANRSIHSEKASTHFLDKARRYCAYAEQCESAVRQKLASWGATANESSSIIEQLRAERYLDDERYARAYCESKLLHQHWGRMKVAYQLRIKQLPREVIDGALNAIDEDAYLQMLQEVAARKRKELGEDPQADRKLISFLAARGFTASEINQAKLNNDRTI
ncbi:MAG: RecX family transcriptional regulator [Bacteroidales bacterium]|nr:RecX family transcriptional regulator [Bacteroidales bacterium]